MDYKSGITETSSSVEYFDKNMILKVLNEMRGHRITLLERYEIINKNEVNINELHAEEKLLGDLLSYFSSMPGAIIAPSYVISLEEIVSMEDKMDIKGE